MAPLTWSSDPSTERSASIHGSLRAAQQGHQGGAARPLEHSLGTGSTITSVTFYCADKVMWPRGGEMDPIYGWEEAGMSPTVEGPRYQDGGNH